MHDELPTNPPGGEMSRIGSPPFENGQRAVQNRRLSEVIAMLAKEATGPISVATIRDALGDRSFAALLIFFAAINLLPLPPGTTLILGLPLILVAAQMVIGKTSAWLPRFVLDKSLSETQFRRMSGRLVPRLQRLERFVQPRYWPFYPSHDERVIGFLALIMGLTVTLPIPLGNWFPALATVLLGLALSERDGLVLGIAVTIGVLALCVVAFVIGSAGWVALHIFA
jgi:hypothetical protein